MPYGTPSRKTPSKSRQGLAAGMVKRQERDEWIERLGSRIKIMGDCWIVDGKPNTYGQVVIGGKQSPAHRVTFEMFHRDVPTDGLDIHHKCERPGCVNPNHLAALTRSEHAREHAALRRVG